MPSQSLGMFIDKKEWDDSGYGLISAISDITKVIVWSRLKFGQSVSDELTDADVAHSTVNVRHVYGGASVRVAYSGLPPE